MAALRTHFATVSALVEYLTKEGFSEISNGQWLSTDGLITAEVYGGATAYIVEYFA